MGTQRWSSSTTLRYKWEERIHSPGIYCASAAGAGTCRKQAKLSPHSHGTYILGRKQTIMAKQIEKNIQIRITTRKETKNFVTAMSHKGLSELGPESEAMTRADQELWQQVQRRWGRDSLMEIQEEGRWSSKLRSSKPCWPFWAPHFVPGPILSPLPMVY